MNIGQTWEWDGATWSQTATGPTTQANHRIAFDLARRRGVRVAGGAACGGSVPVWEYHTPATPCSAPSDCGSGFCVTSVKNGTDPDSCSGTCNGLGTCVP